MLPVVPDTGLAPCQAVPLIVTSGDAFLSPKSHGTFESFDRLDWDDLRPDGNHLHVGNRRLRISSPRVFALLRRFKELGVPLESAVEKAWAESLSPSRARFEWRRWKLVSQPLSVYGPTLTAGFWIGLPLVYRNLGTVPTLALAAGLWGIMVITAAHLWWLARRVYPDARSALRMDALLAMLIPFHAMRAMEIASVHAMGSTHPVGLILATGDLENPWLHRFVRDLLYPSTPEERRRASALLKPIGGILAKLGKSCEDFDRAPYPSTGCDGSEYCPRCQAIYCAGSKVCHDCGGVQLCAFQLHSTTKVQG